MSKNQKSTKQQEKKIEKQANKNDSAKGLLEIADKMKGVADSFTNKDGKMPLRKSILKKDENNQYKNKTYYDSIINTLFTGFDAEYIINSIESAAKYGFEVTKESIESAAKYGFEVTKELVDSLSNIATKTFRMMNDAYLSANKGQIYVDIKNKLEGIDKPIDSKVYNRNDILNEAILKESLKKKVILEIIESHLDLNFNNNLPKIRNIINDGVNYDVIKKDYSNTFSKNQEKNKKRIAILTFKPNEELKKNIVELVIKKIENQAPEYRYILEHYNKNSDIFIDKDYNKYEQAFNLCNSVGLAKSINDINKLIENYNGNFYRETKENIINKMTELSKSEVLTDKNFIIGESKDIKSINQRFFIKKVRNLFEKKPFSIYQIKSISDHLSQSYSKEFPEDIFNGMLNIFNELKNSDNSNDKINSFNNSSNEIIDNIINYLEKLKEASEYNEINISANNIINNNEKFFNICLKYCVQNNKMMSNKEFCKKFAVDIALIADNSEEEKKNKIYNELFSTLNESLGDKSNKQEYFFYYLESDNKKHLGIKEKDKDHCFKNEITGLYNLLLDSNNRAVDQKKPFLKQVNSCFVVKPLLLGPKDYIIK